MKGPRRAQGLLGALIVLVLAAVTDSAPPAPPLPTASGGRLEPPASLRVPTQSGAQAATGVGTASHQRPPAPRPQARGTAAGAGAQQQQQQQRRPPAQPRPTPAALKQNAPQRCSDLPSGSTAAVDALLRCGPGVLFSDLKWGIQKFGLEGELRRASRGRVLVLPSNSEMQRRFVPLGLYRQLGKIPLNATRELRRMVATQLAVPRSSIPPKLGCSSVLYVAHKMGDKRRWARAPGVPRGGAGGGGVSAASTGEADFGSGRFSVLGQGYNVITGLPLSVGMSSLDPGFTLQPIFLLNTSEVTSLPTTGGSCTSQFSTDVFNSASDFKESLGISLGVSADFGIASLSGNANFNSLSKTSSATQTITTNSGAKVYLGGYGLGRGPAALTLHPAFVANAKPLFEAAVRNEVDQYALQSFIDNYGTHYITTVYWGGLAAVTSQMTASTYSSFQQTDVSVSVAAQVAMVQVSVSVDYSSTQTDTVRSNSQTFGEILIPSLVNITLFNAKQVNDPLTDPLGGTTYIDCVQWTYDIRTAVDRYGWRSPVHYSIAPLTQVFNYENIWPVSFRPQLKSVRAMLYKFITTCGYLSQFDEWSKGIENNPRYSICPVVDPNCVKGTYRARRVGRCRSCYGDGTEIGPNCNSTGAIACTSDYCFCRPQVAAAARLYGCQPLRGDPWVDAPENWWGAATCPAGLVITSVSSVQYGGNGRFSSLSYIEVYRRCIGHAACAVQASNDVFGDPAPGVAKRLKFTWECGYNRYLRVKNGNNGDLTCPDAGSGQLVIGQDIRPYYGKLLENPRCNASDLYSKTTSIQGKVAHTTGASPGFWGDPCGSTAGDYYLGLHYTCVFPWLETESRDGHKEGDANAKEIKDGETAVADCGSRRFQYVDAARWTAFECGGKDSLGRVVITEVRAKLGLDRGWPAPNTGYYGKVTFKVNSDNLGPDPCNGKEKKLTFRYTCL